MERLSYLFQVIFTQGWIQLIYFKIKGLDDFKLFTAPTPPDARGAAASYYFIDLNLLVPLVFS